MLLSGMMTPIADATKKRMKTELTELWNLTIRRRGNEIAELKKKLKKAERRLRASDHSEKDKPRAAQSFRTLSNALETKRAEDRKARNCRRRSSLLKVIFMI